MQSSKEEQGEIRKPSSVINAKKQRKTIEWERLEISSRELEIPREHFMLDGHSKGQKQKTLRRGGKNTQKNYTKKDLKYPDNHDGMITQLEPDILECEVKWALGSITTNKSSRGDGIPVELFQILKDDALKCFTQNASKFGKRSSGHRTGKGQFSFQSQRKTMPKNIQTTAQLQSSHTLAK